MRLPSPETERVIIDRIRICTSNSGPRNGEKPRSALILYGSETGNAQDVAEEVGRMAERLRFDTTVLDMDSIQLRGVLRPTVVIFALSTTGQGEMPQNSRAFWKILLSAALKPGVLRKVKFASFGLGDSSYARYNVAHRMLCNRMQQLGAQEFCQRGEGNEQHPEGHSAGYGEWIVALKQKLSEVFPLPDGVEPIPDDQFLEPKWRLDLDHDHEKESAPHTNGHASDANDNKDTLAADASPSPDLLPVKNTHHAFIESNDRVTAPSHFQDVRLLDLHLKTSISYPPGAIAVVYPKNFPSDVQDFITLMSWQNIADKPLHLTPTTPASNPTLSPLRHLNLPHPLTLRWLLENVLDIMSIPRRTFFASLLHFSSTATEDSTYQRDRLLELADPTLIDELWDYTTRPKRTILEVMTDFTTIKIPSTYALTVLPLMKGRQFSIASGGTLLYPAQGGTRVQLLVAIANPPSPIIKYRKRHGICTRYIASLHSGQELNIGLQPGYLDIQPSDITKPVLMIGPGTGIAPIRALTYHRHLQSPAALSRDVLLFGCRAENADYFFQPEWRVLEQETGLTVLTAFSRDEGRPKQYVQDLIRLHAARVRALVKGEGGMVFVCGSSGNMPKGVREALVEVLMGVRSGAGEEGGNEGEVGEGGMGREEAEGYLDGMEKVGRFKQETW